MLQGYVPGMPGIRSVKNAVHRIVFKSGQFDAGLPGGRIIDGTKSRDASNDPYVGVLRAGKLMGKITSGGLYRPSVIGKTTAAYTSGGLSLTVSAATATEVARLITLAGASISLKLVGPPSAAGTVAVTSVTASAASGTTITVADLGVNKVTDSLLTPADGSQLPVTLIPDGYGVPVLDLDGTSLSYVPFGLFPISGLIDASQIIDWPADTSTQAWIQAQLNAAAGGQFIFDNIY